MSTCPCCSDVLLRHFQRGSLSWFCRSCWSEMPIIEENHNNTAIIYQLNLDVTAQNHLSTLKYAQVAA
jgi:hypothetical protein